MVHLLHTFFMLPSYYFLKALLSENKGIEIEC